MILAELLAGVERDFTWILIDKIYERSFEISITFHFACLIYHQCRKSSTPILQCDRFIDATNIVDITIIKIIPILCTVEGPKH